MNLSVKVLEGIQQSNSNDLAGFTTATNKKYDTGNIEQLRQFTVDIIESWYIDVEAELKANLQKKNISNSDQLLNSFTAKVVPYAGQFLFDALISFSAHGRMQEMRGLRFGDTQPPIEVIKEWIDRKGIQNFRLQPYSSGRSRTALFNIPSAKTSLAYVIARSIRLKGKRKTRKWYAKSMFSRINKLQAELLRTYSTASLDLMISEFKKDF